jgi:hypothetical protein
MGTMPTKEEIAQMVRSTPNFNAAFDEYLAATGAPPRTRDALAAMRMVDTSNAVAYLLALDALRVALLEDGASRMLSDIETKLNVLANAASDGQTVRIVIENDKGRAIYRTPGASAGDSPTLIDAANSALDGLLRAKRAMLDPHLKACQELETARSAGSTSSR